MEENKQTNNKDNNTSLNLLTISELKYTMEKINKIDTKNEINESTINNEKKKEKTTTDIENPEESKK